MLKDLGEYELDSDFSRIQFERVHSWLTTTYWSPGVTLDRVVKAATNSSLVVSAFSGETQVGYLRVVSDRTTFAWVCDVFVEEAHRGKGIARSMLNFALEQPDHAGLRRWILATKDAHGVYEGCGFEPLPSPERWMLKRTQPSG